VVAALETSLASAREPALRAQLIATIERCAGTATVKADAGNRVAMPLVRQHVERTQSAQNDELLTRGTLQQIAVIEDSRFVIRGRAARSGRVGLDHLNRGD